MKRILAGAALIFACCASAHAADISVVAWDSQDLPTARPAAIQIKGFIEKLDYLDFQLRAGMANKAVVVLDSKGGFAGSAIHMGRIIRTKGFDTAVPDDTICTSACALIWLAGNTRFVGRGARIGFHAVRNVEGKKVETDKANIGVGNYLVQLGYSSGLVHYVLKAPPQSMTWMTQVDSARYAIDAKPFAGVPGVRLITRATRPAPNAHRK